MNELNPTAKIVAQSIKKEADLLAGQSDSIGKDFRYHQICQLAEQIATDLYLHGHGPADRLHFLKACGVAPGYGWPYTNL